MQEKKQKRSIGQCKCCRLHFFDDCGNEELCEHCLRFIANYTKQVREGICDKIRENAISHNNLEVDMYYITAQQLYEIEKGEPNG